MQDFGKVAVLMGGFSSEREVSLDSGNAILTALKSKGVDAHAFDPAETELFELKIKVLILHSIHCMAVMAKMAQYKAHWKHWQFLTQVVAC